MIYDILTYLIYKLHLWLSRNSSGFTIGGYRGKELYYSREKGVRVVAVEIPLRK